MLILLDMDSVVADFNHRHCEMDDIIKESCYSKPKNKHLENFFRGNDIYYSYIPVMDGAQEAVQQLFSLGHEIRFFTSPLTANPYYPDEKFTWVEKYFGNDFLKRIIIAKDRTWIKGNILIDDKPIVYGSLSPVWQHIIYDRPYNRIGKGSRLTWDNYQAVLADLDLTA